MGSSKAGLARVVVFVLLADTGVLGATASDAWAASTVPATLVGETLGASTNGAVNPSNPTCSATQCFQVTASCNPSGTSTFSFTTLGVATGPFPGTFSASGAVSIGPETIAEPVGSALAPLAGPNLTFTESFTIHSGTTTITGTKQLAPNVIPSIPGSGAGNCSSEQASMGIHNYADQASATYTAKFSGSTGSVTQTGNTAMNFQDSSFCTLAACESVNFDETFATAQQLPGCSQNPQDNQNQGRNGQGCANPQPTSSTAPPPV